MNIRNIAIIAHVDHGKTTLVDALLKQSETDIGHAAEGEQIMDSNELERERGITIFSKNAAVQYQGVKINIIDTPGHADFGGEVERVLNMADGALLLVDAQEGPMPQTRFVLKKALARGLKIIVVINKIDKPNARVNFVVEKVLELFLELGTTDAHLNFPIIYAAGRLGKAGDSPDLAAMKDIAPLFQKIIGFIPPPAGDAEAPLQLMVVSVSYDNYQGKLGVGRIERGSIWNGQTVARIARDGKISAHKITTLRAFAGLGAASASALAAGDIAVVGGIEGIAIGDTLTTVEQPEPLPPVAVEQPTVKMVFSVNNSPFMGREGKYCTSRNLKERLEYELDNDVALIVQPGASADEFVVSGRGELHLGILIEKMRREGYELQVSRPEVIYKEENGETLEPAEDAWIEVPEAHISVVIQKMSARQGELKNMSVQGGSASFHFFVPTRGLIGFRNELLLESRGQGVINTLFAGYFPEWGGIRARTHGSLIAHEDGTATAYGLLNAQARGTLFIGPSAPVYEGQVVGENAKDEDLVVNVCREKQLTNFRTKTDATTDDLIPQRQMSLEQCLEYIGDDELVEITPTSIRIRKKVLKNAMRKNER